MVHTNDCALVMLTTACNTGMNKFSNMIGTKLLVHLRSTFLNDSVEKIETRETSGSTNHDTRLNRFRNGLEEVNVYNQALKHLKLFQLMDVTS